MWLADYIVCIECTSTSYKVSLTVKHRTVSRIASHFKEEKLLCCIYYLDGESPRLEVIRIWETSPRLPDWCCYIANPNPSSSEETSTCWCDRPTLGWKICLKTICSSCHMPTCPEHCMRQLYARAACSVCLALANFSCLFSPCTMKKKSD